MEIWKDVVGYEGLYKVSNLGNIKSFHSSQNRPAAERNVHPSNAKGYMRIGLYKNKQCKRKYVHRIVAEAFIPNPDNKPEVNHINGDKTNNKLDNLEWVTASENSYHAVGLGLKYGPKGEQHGASKLTEQNVLEAKILRAEGWMYSSLSRKYGVTEYAINAAINGKTWKHLQQEQIMHVV